MTALFGLVALIFGMSMASGVYAQSEAQVRVLHASPDAPAVDVYVDGDLTLENVPFFTASQYLSLPAGSYQIQVTPTGESPDAAVIDAEATVEGGMAYTIAATGLVANIQPTIIVDDLSAPADGQAKVRVYHFSPDAPAVDVRLADGTVLISSLAFPDASEYLEVPAGSYDLQVVPAGADDVVIDLPGTTLEAGNIYSVFAANEVASITPELSVFTPEAPATGDTTGGGDDSGAPGQLPTTSGETLPLSALIAFAVALLLTGAFVLRRQIRR
jgi:hypothetical protein